MKALARAAVDRRRSTLFLWMYEHHAEFAEKVLKRAGRPNWKSIARELGKIRWMDEALTTLSGDAPTGEQARQIWVQVRKLLDREERDRRPLQQSAAQPRDEFSPRSDDAPDEDDFSDIERIK